MNTPPSFRTLDCEPSTMEGSPKPDPMDQGAEPCAGTPEANGNGRADGPTAAEKRVALEEVLESGSFLRAEQKRSFLRYICDMELAGRGGELSEYLIGVEALGRPPGYSTGEDSSVRRHAHDLRQRLEEVYATELSAAHVRIELPKGRYAPRFQYWDGAGLSPAAALEPADAESASLPPPAPASGGQRRAFVLGLLVGAVTAILAVVGWRFIAGSHEPQPPAGPRSIEAEAHSTTMTGSAARGDCRNCSQGGRVRWVGRGNEVTLNDIAVSEAGNYTLQVDYVLDGERGLFLSVNGGPQVALVVKGKSWAIPSTAFVNVALRAGSNSVRFFNDQAYGPDLDRIVIR